MLVCLWLCFVFLGVHFCGGVVVFLCFCVFVLVWLCFCVGVVVF